MWASTARLLSTMVAPAPLRVCMQDLCFADACVPAREFPRVIVVRHGESTWNADDRFTGWADAPLTRRGVRQMKATANLLRYDLGLECEVSAVYTSMLKRTVQSGWVLSESMDLHALPVRTDWRLNERSYGDLTGMYKSEVADRVGADAFEHLKRFPPDPHPGSCYDINGSARIRALVNEAVPGGETFLQASERCASFWDDVVVPHIDRRDTIIAVASKNIIKAMLLDAKYRNPELRVLRLSGIDVSDEPVLDIDIPNGDSLILHP